MFLRMAEVSQLANLNKALLLYRINPRSTTAQNIGIVRARIAHACLCAEQRAAGLPEIPFEQFSAERRARPFVLRALDRADWYASNQYRAGLAQILDSRPVEGYARIGWSAICSPARPGKEFVAQAGTALTALRAFGEFVKTDHAAKQGTPDWITSEDRMNSASKHTNPSCSSRASLHGPLCPPGSPLFEHILLWLLSIFVFALPTNPHFHGDISVTLPVGSLCVLLGALGVMKRRAIVVPGLGLWCLWRLSLLYLLGRVPSIYGIQATKYWESHRWSG